MLPLLPLLPLLPMLPELPLWPELVLPVSLLPYVLEPDVLPLMLPELPELPLCPEVEPLLLSLGVVP